MHEHHKGHHGHHHDERHEGDVEMLGKLLIMLDHWIDHGDSHAEEFRDWAQRAGAAGEEEIAREVNLAAGANETIKQHLKRAKAILAAKLVLKKQGR